MTVRTRELRLRSGFTYDDSNTELRMTLPITPWIPSARSIGGDIESDAGVRSSFIICQRETLGLTLRFWENQWADVQAWLDVVQDGMPFTWTPDPTYRNYPEYTDIVLEGPAVGNKYEATPDPDFPRVLRLPIILGRVGCTLFNMKEIPPPPQFAAFTGDGMIHVTNVYGTVSLLYSAVGGGGRGNGSGGGGGGASYGDFDAKVGTIFVHVGKGSYYSSSGHGDDSYINFPIPGGSGTAGAIGGNPAFGANGGGSGSGQDPEGNGTGGYPGGGGAGVGFAGSVGPPPLPAYGASGGGGGGGAGGPGTDAHASAGGGSGHADAGNGGQPGATFHGAHGGGGGGGANATGAGSATAGSSGGGSGQGGFNNEDGHDGMVIVEWTLGEIVATQEI